MNKDLVLTPALPTADPLEGEPELRQELAGLFLEDYEQSLSKIRQLITDREASELRNEAHTLKGSTGVFRDQAAFAAAFQMEMIAHDATWDGSEAAWEMLRAETLRLAAVLTRLVSQDEACADISPIR